LKDASLAPLPADGGSDVHGWNEEFKTLQASTWLYSLWLYTECYMYRLVHSFFSKLHTSLRHFRYQQEAVTPW